MIFFASTAAFRTCASPWAESDFQRREVLDLAGQLSQDAVDVAKLPEGAALPEAEMFRSEILACSRLTAH